MLRINSRYNKVGLHVFLKVNKYLLLKGTVKSVYGFIALIQFKKASELTGRSKVRLE